MRTKTSSVCPRMKSFSLANSKRCFHLNSHGYGLTVFPGGLELPLLDGFDGLFIEAHAERANYGDVVRETVGSNDERKNTCALMLGFARSVGVTRLRAFDRSGWGHAAAGFPLRRVIGGRLLCSCRRRI